MVVSTLTGGKAVEELANPDYWVSHDEARPVLFMKGIRALEKLGCDTFLELGPRPMLVNMGRLCARGAGLDWFATLLKDTAEPESVLRVSRAMGCHVQTRRASEASEGTDVFRQVLSPVMRSRKSSAKKERIRNRR